MSTTMHQPFLSGTAARTVAAFALAAAPVIAVGHGDEPHGDEPHPVAAATGATPRFEAFTEAFELVGRLHGDGLVLRIHRFASNEPVADARLELESGERKALATYDAADGSYRVAEAAFVDPLREPGQHALLMTLTAGKDADLLEASLDVAAAAHGHDDPSRPGWALAAGLLLAGAVLLVGGALALRGRARREVSA